jgi:hypothetical protein
MKRVLQAGTVVCLLTTAAFASEPEKYLHVRAAGGAVVSINLPLSLAEKVISASILGKLNHGKVTIDNADMQDVDIKTILDAVKTAPDGEFVTVQDKDQDVRVAKSQGNLVIHVDKQSNKNKGGEKADVIVPMALVDALITTDKHQFDLVAAIHALGESGDKLIVTTHSDQGDVKVWVDTQRDANEPSSP